MKMRAIPIVIISLSITTIPFVLIDNNISNYFKFTICFINLILLAVIVKNYKKF